MRSLEQCYEIALEYYKNNRECQRLGICLLVSYLISDNVLTKEEISNLKRHLYKNQPSVSLHKELYYGGGSVYWWPRGETEPRIKFLKKMIIELGKPWYVKLWERLTK